MSSNAAEGYTESKDPAVVPQPQVSGPWTVQKVLDTIQPAPPVEESTSPLPFFHALERLKTTKREGWRRFNIQRGESIADHMYRMALMSLVCPPALAARLDLAKCTKMCLIHDMAESLVGDITPVDGVAKPEKSRREAETMDYLTRNLLGKVDEGAAGRQIRAIWQEYEDSQTLESQFVHDLDKVELLLQMVEYEKRANRTLDLGEFAYVETRLVLPEMQQWGKDVLRERDEYWGASSHVHGEEGVEGGVREERLEQQKAYYEREGDDGTSGGDGAAAA
ncbi:HD domain-containing protein [Biscogniauxia mediterranea]|nr:HD domain-containing protein [Biscogniauxia mediterranea]